MLPLIPQPGEPWMDPVSLDVLGVLIARVSGPSLGALPRERIFDPLGRKGTAFRAPSETIARRPGFDSSTAARTRSNGSRTRRTARGARSRRPGGGGLVSTIDDDFGFSRTILNNDRHGREPISHARRSRGGPRSRPSRAPVRNLLRFARQIGFGMGSDVQRREIFHTGPIRLDQRLWHDGYTDPAEGRIGIPFTQRRMDSLEPPKVFTDFWALA